MLTAGRLGDVWHPRRPIGALDCCGRDDVRGLARGSFGKYAQISVVKVLASQATTSQARLCLVRQAKRSVQPISELFAVDSHTWRVETGL